MFTYLAPGEIGPKDTEALYAQGVSYLSIALNLGFILYYSPMELVIIVFIIYLFKKVRFAY